MFESRKIIVNGDLFSPLQTEVLLLNAKSAGMAPGRPVGHFIGDNLVTNKNLCDINFIDYSQFNEQVEFVIEKCKEYVESTYNLPCEFSILEFIKYEVGGHYISHIDGQYLEGNTIKIGPEQKDITCILYLNDDYEGGELIFNFFNKTIIPQKGDVVTFPSNWRYLHKVSTITEGERYAIVIWFKTTPAISIEETIDSAYIRTINNANNY